MNRNISFLSALLLLVFSTAGVAAQVEKTVSKDKAVKAIDAPKVYRENCAICHGDQGDGNTRASGGLRPPPRNFTTLEAASELDRSRMIHSVTNGRPGTGMMAHKDRLTTAEIAAVVDYIRATFMQKIEKKHVKSANLAGEKIFRKNCSVCHGDKGSSAVWAQNGLNPPPRDFTTVEASQILTRERMIKSVTEGRPGTGMMPFTSKLSKTDIENVVDYIRQTFMRLDEKGNPLPATQASGAPTTTARAGHPGMPGFEMPAVRGNPHAQQNPHAGQGTMARANPHAGLNSGMPQDPHAGMTMGSGQQPMRHNRLPAAQVADMAAEMPNGLVGNVQEGRAFFMSNCFACHGKKGDGNGPRAHFNTPRPRNFTSDASRRMLNRVRLYNGIMNGKVGTVMPAWGKVLSDQQIANVAEFVFQTYIAAKPEKAGKPVKMPDTQSKKKDN